MCCTQPVRTIPAPRPPRSDGARSQLLKRFQQLCDEAVLPSQSYALIADDGNGPQVPPLQDAVARGHPLHDHIPNALIKEPEASPIRLQLKPRPRQRLLSHMLARSPRAHADEVGVAIGLDDM
eukprot:CAMPEP_0176252098 /NCGR_PEP_ID=MMETSP0121_2-20121125/35335_1 /TAXON_ID=160619 /ORGANISM="Kryptoperidinium foliaceum, Strain CCMP 1326" /LENGTH=122 /DNA_ID=CAMNT_0017591853 /DNA_START=403 /DNA_END=771 /DNA_ORIENTATION=+